MLKSTLLVLFCFYLLPNFSYAQVLATVGRKNITRKMFDKKYAEIKKHVFNPPSPKLFLEDLVRFEVGVQEARKKNLQNDPIVIDRFNQELYKALLEKSIGEKIQKIKVNQKEMKAYYRKYPEIQTSHILIQFKPDSTEKEIAIAKKRADELYKEVKSSKRKFSELVKLYSDDSISKKTQGNIGFQSAITLAPTYYSAARKLKVGQISRPVRTRFGFHIIKLTGLQKFQDANQRQVRAAVFDQKRKIQFDRFFRSVKKKYKIKTYKNEIKKLPR